MTGTLYLVPNLLGLVPPENVLPARTIAVARDLLHWVVETPKPARAFIKSLAPQRAMADLDIRPLAESGDLTDVCVAADLTLTTETIERRSAAAWRREDASRFAKRPAMFVLMARR